MDERYLKLARQAREENNTEDAKKFYDMARSEDPENVEAKYFYAYYNLCESINKEVPSKFIDYTKVVVPCIKMLKELSLSDREKIETLKTIVTTHIEEALSINDYVQGKIDHSTINRIDTNGIYTQDQANLVQKTTILTLEETGDAVANLFGADSQAMDLAAKSWKTVIERNFFSQWYYFQSGSSKEESANKWNELVKKIQKVDTSFATPEKPKAFLISCGSK